MSFDSPVEILYIVTPFAVTAGIFSDERVQIISPEDIPESFTLDDYFLKGYDVEIPKITFQSNYIRSKIGYLPSQYRTKHVSNTYLNFKNKVNRQSHHQSTSNRRKLTSRPHYVKHKHSSNYILQK